MVNSVAHLNLVDVEKLYQMDSNIKREDIEILKEWLKKQPHLPQVTEQQLIVVLHSCFYSVELCKKTIDIYFTVKSQWSDLFDCLTKEAFAQCTSVGFMNVLPNFTPEGSVVMLLKLLNKKSEDYHFVNMLKALNMIVTTWIHQYGFANDAMIIVDMEGGSLSHLAKTDWMAARKAIYLLQEGAAARIKIVHCINVVPFIDVVMAMVKPFLNLELLDKLMFHKSIETMYQYVPQDCLPQEYGGKAPSIQTLNAKCLENIIENYDILLWHDTQKVDESKRPGQRKDLDHIFGLDGTFRKLELD